jgi:hypothetical protein
MNQAAPAARRSPEFAATHAATAKRRGTKTATIAISRKLLTRAWHLLATPASTPAASAAPAATTAPQTGRVTQPRARPLTGRRRPAAALDPLAEQPGPRTPGHGRRPHGGAGWVLARPLRQPRRGQHHHPQRPSTKGPSPLLMIRRRSPASSSFVLAAARLRALQLDPSRTAT